MSQEEKTELAIINAPYNKQIKLEDMAYDSGMHLMRITIKEGSRFTQVDLDPATARGWADNMIEWANTHDQDNQSSLQ